MSDASSFTLPFELKPSRGSIPAIGRWIRIGIQQMVYVLLATLWSLSKDGLGISIGATHGYF
jgi:hypothetical protein